MKKKEIHFITSDDVQLNGFGFQADDSHAVVLLFLGMGGDARGKSIDHFARALADKGISTVVFSSRGHGESKGLFLFEKNVQDVEELEKKYAALAKKQKQGFLVMGHSIGARSIVCANIVSDVVLLNPTLFRTRSALASIPLLRRLYLAWWNYSIFGKISFTHFGNVYFTRALFKDLITQTSHQNFPTNKLKGRCLLLAASKDHVAQFDNIEIREQVKTILRRRYSAMYDSLVPDLDHNFSDGSKTFMRSYQISRIINTINSFSRNGAK